MGILLVGSANGEIASACWGAVHFVEDGESCAWCWTGDDQTPSRLFLQTERILPGSLHGRKIHPRD